ncbi:hypothetical protein [Umezakia ovalisporum]|uniref:Uncharacterized protein n=1 Tax=Umezakia ovalisporum FSS-43 TaxID=2740520 RepID=A0ABT6JZ98_9CYAN|nr:hypothetical protein [Umezakia ovalisporum]MDH6055443.1 hypothetical protein [Umezakia ovalisporum FSS-43]MDH6069985.1 hypothetical protein [Umezakia ovalisporum CobakiLakeA]
MLRIAYLNRNWYQSLGRPLHRPGYCSAQPLSSSLATNMAQVFDLMIVRQENLRDGVVRCTSSQPKIPVIAKFTDLA